MVNVGKYISPMNCLGYTGCLIGILIMVYTPQHTWVLGVLEHMWITYPRDLPWLTSPENGSMEPKWPMRFEGVWTTYSSTGWRFCYNLNRFPVSLRKFGGVFRVVKITPWILRTSTFGTRNHRTISNLGEVWVEWIRHVPSILFVSSCSKNWNINHHGNSVFPHF